MHKHIHALPEPIVDPADGGLQVRLEVRSGAVHDIESIRLELDALLCMSVDGREPGCVEDLDECADAMGGEEGRVEDGGFSSNQ